MKGMPTKFEREGQRFAERQAAPAVEKQKGASDGKSLWQHALDWQNSTVTKEASDYGAVIIEPDQYHEVSMTNLFMATFPDIRFRDYLKRRLPSIEPIDLYATWGYDMKYLPPNGLGAAYSDVYSAKLWVEKKILLPIVPTSISYMCMITRNSITGNRLASENEQRADRRDFEAGFVKDKRLAQEFYNAGAIKGQQGDNHVAFLTQALAKVLSIKQADEAQAFCEITVDRDVYNNLIVLEEDARASTSAQLAKQLASPWLKDQGRELHELILPSAAANAEEILMLLYLMGAMDNKEAFYRKSLSDHPMTIVPYFGGIATKVDKLLRIPLCNSQHMIDMTPYIGKKIRLELGVLEETLTSYVKRFNLHDQVNIAKSLLCTAAISNPLGEQIEQVVAVPKPNHACEYDLWQRSNTKENTTFVTFSVYEEANLLVALLQIQGDVMRQAVCTSALEHLEDMRTPMLSVPGKTNYEKWLNTTFNKGPRQLLSGWCSGVLGMASVEVESLITNNLQAFSSLLWKTIRSDAVKVSAQLWSGVRCTKGPLGLIWDKARRDREAERSYVDSATAGVLKSLYNNKYDCYDARGPFMLQMCTSTTQIRGLKRDVVASGQRNILNLRGEPKLLYFGTKPENEPLRDRLKDAGTAKDLVSHYEPTFDLDSAVSLIQTKIVLAMLDDEAEKKKHENEPTTAGSLLSKLVEPDNYKLPEMSDSQKVQYPGRPFVPAPYDDGGYAQQIAEAKAFESKHEAERWQKVASRSGWSTSVGGRVVFNSRNARSNGLSDTMLRLVEERKKRLEDAKSTTLNPANLVGSEVLDPSSIEVCKRAEQLYKESSMEEEIVGDIPKGLTRAIHESFDEIDVPGDGRCGIRALHQGMVLKNQTKSLSELMQMEATMFGGVSNRLPRETHVDDGAMALMADKLGYHLIVLEQESIDSTSLNTVRYHKNDDKPEREVLFVKIIGNHWYALQDRVKKEFDDVDEFIETRRWYYRERHQPNEIPIGRTSAGGGRGDSQLPPLKQGRGLEYKSGFNRKMRQVIKEKAGVVGRWSITCNEIGSKGDYVDNIMPDNMEVATPYNMWIRFFQRMLAMERDFGHHFQLWRGLKPENIAAVLMNPVAEWYGFTPEETNRWLHSEMTEDSIRAFVAFTRINIGVVSVQKSRHNREAQLLGTRTVYMRGEDNSCVVTPIYEINGKKMLGWDWGRMKDLIRGMGGLNERIQYMSRPYIPVDAKDVCRYTRRQDKSVTEGSDMETPKRRIAEKLAELRGHIESGHYECPGFPDLILEAERPSRGSMSVTSIDAIAAGFAMVGRPADAKWVLTSGMQWINDNVGLGIYDIGIFDVELAQLLVLCRGGRAWYWDDISADCENKESESYKIVDWYSRKNADTIPMVLSRSGHENWKVWELSVPLKALKRLRELSYWCKSTADKPVEDKRPHRGIALPPSNTTGGMKTNDPQQWQYLGLLTMAGGTLLVGGAVAGTAMTTYRYRYGARLVFRNLFAEILTATHSMRELTREWLEENRVDRPNWRRYGTLPYNQARPEDEHRLFEIMADETPRSRENTYRSWYSLGSWESFWSVDLGGDEHDEV